MPLSPWNDPPPAGRAWATPWAVGFFAAVAFLPVLVYGFVDWDDEENIFANPDFGGLSGATVRWAWVTFRLGVYQPLGWMLLELQASLWGLDGRRYHAVNLAFHAANAAALYGLIATLIDRSSPGDLRHDRRAVLGGSAVAGLLFAVHPLRVEAVAWASCQSYIPSVLCAVLATRAYLHAHPAVGPDRWGWVAVAWLVFVAGVLFKAVAATLPVVLLILDIYPLRRLGPGRWLDRRVWAEKLPFAAVGLAAMVVAVLARTYSGAPVVTDPLGPFPRLLQACYAVCFYLTKTAWPTGLACFYVFPERVNLFTWPYGPAFLAVTSVCLGAAILSRRLPGLSAACAAFLVMLVPNLAFVRIGNQTAADRYTYFASIPLAVVVAGVLARLAHRAGRRPAALIPFGAGLAVAVVLATLTWRQCQT